MSSGVQATGQRVPSLWREVCDKCGTRMELEGRGYSLSGEYARTAARWSGSTAIGRPVGASAASGPSLALVDAGVPILTAR
jgi:hypothetical protein